MRFRCLDCFKEEYGINDDDLIEGPASQALNWDQVLTKRIPYFDDKLEELQSFVHLVNVEKILPEEFEWSDSDSLPMIFRNYDVMRGKGRKAPQALIKDAEGNFDKCLVCIWYFKLNKKERREVFEELKQIYRAPSKSNEPKKGANAQADAAINAARAAGEAAAPADGEEYVGMADSLDRRADAAKKSHSYKNSRAGSKKPPKTIPENPTDMRRRQVTRIEEQIVELHRKHQKLTDPIEGCPAYNNIIVLHLYNVKDPYMKGRSKGHTILDGEPDPYLDDARPILNLYGREESDLIEAVGGADKMAILEKEYQVSRVLPQTKLLPTCIVKNKGKKALPQTPSRGRKKLAAMNADGKENTDANMEEEEETSSTEEEEETPNLRRQKRKRIRFDEEGAGKGTLKNLSP